MSIGMGMTFVPLTLLATTNVDSDDAGLASGLFNTSQQIGGALGLAVLSTLATSQDESPARHRSRAADRGDERLPRRVRRRCGDARRRHRRGRALRSERGRGADRRRRGSGTGLTVAVTRELRADAQRNLARVLEAAREVFAEEGIDAPCDRDRGACRRRRRHDLPPLPEQGRADRRAARTAGRATDRGGRRRARRRRPGDRVPGAARAGSGDADRRPRSLRRDRHRSACPRRSARRSSTSCTRSSWRFCAARRTPAPCDPT